VKKAVSQNLICEMIEERCKVRGIILVCEVVVEMVLDMNRILTTKSDFKDPWSFINVRPRSEKNHNFYKNASIFINRVTFFS
jgi:hypothetical protein